MGKVNQLWQDKRQAEIDAHVKQLLADGYSREEAETMAEEEMEQHARDNGQFGVGA